MIDKTDSKESGGIITRSDILLHDAKTALMYEELRSAIDDGHESMTHADALAEIAAIRAENEQLRAQLEAIGAGGVSGPLIGQPQEMPDLSALTERGAKAWAGVDAQGLRDGVASAGSEPVAPVDRSEAVNLARNMLEVHECKGITPRGVETLCNAVLAMDACLLAHPSPPEGMVGGLQVYRCKIKSRKQIDREIPREQQGWWADVAAGQKLLLRQAVQSDLDRCTLGGNRSRNPADYMCETHNNGSLVSKVALEYMNPEENVFAAPPTTSAGSGKGE